MYFQRQFNRSLISLTVVTVIPFAAISDVNSSIKGCYDTLVSAQIIKQIPSIAPVCKDCIIMRWPWFVDLKIEKILKGAQLPKQQITVLTVQHTNYRTDLGPTRWSLRKNSEGGLNAVKLDEEEHLKRCAKDSTPVRPFIVPRKGQSLDELTQEGAEYYGRE